MTEHRPVIQQGHETVALEAGRPPITRVRVRYIPLGWSSVPGQGHLSQGVG